jgi:hypothetical protein
MAIEQLPSDFVVSEDTARAIEKFTEISVETYERGAEAKSDWEHARSYAVEALQGLLRENPERFTYKDRMQKVADRCREQKRRDVL